MSALELKPCPHCGEAEELYPMHRGLGGGKPYGIDCLRCGADFIPRDHIDAIEAWNRRAPSLPTEPVKGLDRGSSVAESGGSPPAAAKSEGQSLAVLDALEVMATVSSGWRPMTEIPLPDEPFLATVRVFTRGNFSHHDTHVICLSDELEEIHPDFDHGWTLADYEFWCPLPPPPNSSGAE